MNGSLLTPERGREESAAWGQSYGTLPLLYLRPDQSISGRHDIEAADDAEAMLRASHVAALSEEVTTIEVWSGARLVGRLAQPKDPGELT